MTRTDDALKKNICSPAFPQRARSTGLRYVAEGLTQGVYFNFGIK